MTSAVGDDHLPVVELRPFKVKEWRQDKSLPRFYINERLRSNVHVAYDMAMLEKFEANNKEVERQANDYRRSTNLVPCPKAFTTNGHRHNLHPKIKSSWNKLHEYSDDGLDSAAAAATVIWTTTDGFIPKPEREKSTMGEIHLKEEEKQDAKTSLGALADEEVSGDSFIKGSNSHQQQPSKAKLSKKITHRLHPKRKTQVLERAHTFCYGEKQSSSWSDYDIGTSAHLSNATNSPTEIVVPERYLAVSKAGLRHRRKTASHGSERNLMAPSRVASAYRSENALPLIDVQGSLDVLQAHLGKRSIIEQYLSDQLSLCNTRLKGEKKPASWLSWYNPYRPEELPPAAIVKTSNVSSSVDFHHHASLQHKQQWQQFSYLKQVEQKTTDVTPTPRSPKDIGLVKGYVLSQSNTSVDKLKEANDGRLLINKNADFSIEGKENYHRNQHTSPKSLHSQRSVSYRPNSIESKPSTADTLIGMEDKLNLLHNKDRLDVIESSRSNANMESQPNARVTFADVDENMLMLRGKSFVNKGEHSNKQHSTMSTTTVTSNDASQEQPDSYDGNNSEPAKKEHDDRNKIESEADMIRISGRVVEETETGLTDSARDVHVFVPENILQESLDSENED